MKTSREKLLNLSMKNGRLLNSELIAFKLRYYSFLSEPNTSFDYLIPEGKRNTNNDFYIGSSTFISSSLLHFVSLVASLKELPSVINSMDLFSRLEAYQFIVQKWIGTLESFTDLNNAYPGASLSRMLEGIGDLDSRISLAKSFRPKSEKMGVAESSSLREQYFVCNICGSRTNLTTHHLIPRAFFSHIIQELKSSGDPRRIKQWASLELNLKSKYPNNPKNTLYLCHSCHHNYLERIIDNLYTLSSLDVLDLAIIPARLFVLRSVFEFNRLAGKDPLLKSLVDKINNLFVSLLVKEELRFFNLIAKNN